jgi:hypothetical protein
MNFLDTGPFGKLLTAVDHGILPPEVLSQTLLSPITALESAQHTPKLRIMHEHRANLRPLRSRLIRNPGSYEGFLATLSVESPDYYRGMLDAMHAQCVMYPPFLAFHKSRYGKNPPKTIAGSKRFTSDVRDSMQLIISQELPFITSDLDLKKKLSPLLRCQVIHADLDLNCILGAMQITNLGWLTGDRVGCESPSWS